MQVDKTSAKGAAYRGAIGGKTAVLPWFCKIECGGGSSGAPPCYGAGLSLPRRARRAGGAPGLNILDFPLQLVDDLGPKHLGFVGLCSLLDVHSPWP